MRDLSKLKPGQVVAVAGQVWGRCADCLELVRVDKPIFGSWHLCVPQTASGRQDG